jgi:hypothetical protein
MNHDDAYVRGLAEELAQDAELDPMTAAELAIVDLSQVMPRLRAHTRHSHWLLSEWAPYRPGR